MSAGVGEFLGRTGEQATGRGGNENRADAESSASPYKVRNGVTLDHAGPCAGMVPGHDGSVVFEAPTHQRRARRTVAGARMAVLRLAAGVGLGAPDMPVGGLGRGAPVARLLRASAV